MLTMRYLLPLMLVLATCWAGNPIFDSVAPQLIQETSDDYKLPDSVIPTNYVIELTPYFDTGDAKKFTFKGNSQIDLKVQKDTETITFHAKNITLNNIFLEYKNPNDSTKNDTLIGKKKLDEQKDFVIVTLNTAITNKTTNVKLILDYTGVLNDELRGFYRSSYQKENKKRWLATTHFEPVGARQAFPCWDEPAIKATFNIIINVPKDYNAVSNTQVLKNENGRIFFQPTPIMSAYLVAFVVSDYKRLRENNTFDVLTRPDAINSTNFAYNIGQETLKKLYEFTGIDYYSKAKKMDQITIPDFAAGAMENWGLVTYRESALLYTDNKTTTQDKQSIATVIAHEFSHQWFGNLVTCAWWDYIWLNEGFATFFQYYTTDQVVQAVGEGNWQLMDQFVIKNLQASAFVIDATTTTRSLNSEISATTPPQIHSLFDDIAYKKGASILRMLQQFLTEDVFKNGLKRYLNDNEFKPVTPEKLFEAIEKAEPDKVKNALPNNTLLNDVMNNWLNKPGYPVVTVSKIANDRVNLTQERFFLTTQEDATNKTEWYIPITYVTKKEPNTINKLWMNPNTQHILVNDKLDNETWILINKNQIGYYRVNYHSENWNLLAKYLKDDNYTTISNTNRAQLIDDALNLARAGYLAYNDSLQITQYLSRETDYIPWYAAVRAFNFLDNLLQGTENYEKYHIYVASQIKKFTEEVKYDKPEEGTHVIKLGKVLALHTACYYGLETCKNFAKTELEKWLNDEEGKTNLSPDLRSGIICAGLRNANKDTWDKVKDKYKNSTDNNERGDILIGLGCAKSEEIIQNFLNLTIEQNSNINTFSAINSILADNVESFDILLDFINEHIETIKNIDKDETQLTALVNKLANRVVNVEQYGKLSLLTDTHLKKVDKTTALSQAIENLAWIKSYGPEVGALFKDYTQDNSASSITLASFLVLIPILLLFD